MNWDCKQLVIDEIELLVRTKKGLWDEVWSHITGQFIYANQIGLRTSI